MDPDPDIFHLIHVAICTVFLFKNPLGITRILEAEAVSFRFKEVKHLAAIFQWLLTVNFVLICQYVIPGAFP